jgi:PilZ domain
MRRIFQPAQWLGCWLKNRVARLVENRFERRSAHRKNVRNLIAYYWEGTGGADHAVRDISASGAFILSEFQWVSGTIVTMTLQLKDEAVGSAVPRALEVRAKVVRQAPDGVGVQFLFANQRERKRLAKFLQRIPDMEPE